MAAAEAAALFPGLVRDALELALADSFDAEASTPVQAIVGSQHAVGLEDAGTLWRQARLGAVLATTNDPPDLLLRCRALVRQSLRVDEDPEALRTAAIVEHGLWRLTGQGDRLESAVAYARSAVEAGDDGGPESRRRLATLSHYLADRFRRRRDRRDLEEALGLTRAAADPPEPNALAVLGDILLLRFDVTHHEAHLEEAIECAGRGVEASAGSPRRLAAALSNLGLCRPRRFDITGDPLDVDEAVVCGRRARATSDVHAVRAGIQVNLASALSERHESGAGDKATSMKPLT